MSASADENPFKGMHIKDWSALRNLEGRAICPKCSKSRKYFCYTCYIPIPGLEEQVPKLKLPIKIDIIKHASEIDGKSTAAHAAVIAPEDVTIYTYPCIPDYSTEENVVLVFPGKNALSIQEYIVKTLKIDDSTCDSDCSEPCAKRMCLPNSKLPISRAVFIDSTWNQSRGIYKDQRLREIPCVVIQSRISQFWRHQHGSPRWFLATIEAVHQFLVELHIACKLGSKGNTPSPSDESSGNSCVLGCETKAAHPTPADPSLLDEQSNERNFGVDKESSLPDKSSSGQMALPDKQPSKYVKNLALCRGIRSDTGAGAEPGIKLCGPDQWKGKYDGDYDNLLFFFQFMYYKIHSLYEHDKLRSYQRDMT